MSVIQVRGELFATFIHPGKAWHVSSLTKGQHRKPLLILQPFVSFLEMFLLIPLALNKLFIAAVSN